jgi:hypothetical protein
VYSFGKAKIKGIASVLGVAGVNKSLSESNTDDVTGFSQKLSISNFDILPTLKGQIFWSQTANAGIGSNGTYHLNDTIVCIFYMILRQKNINYKLKIKT